MLTVLAFHPGDAEQAKKLLEWIGELGHAQNHELLLGWSMNAERTGLGPPLVELAKRAFKTVYPFPFYDEDERGHPMSANHAWLSCARQIENPHPKVLPVPQPWLWLEPDAVPLVPTWLDRIEAEYKVRGRPFMGDIIPENAARGVQRRPSGVGVYPWNVTHIGQGKVLSLDNRAWDDFLAEDILPYHFQTPLIQDMYCMSRDPDVEPTFPFRDSLELISKEAVLFHRNSDGTLIERLRGKNALPSKPVDTYMRVIEAATGNGAIPGGIPVIKSIRVQITEDTIVSYEDGAVQRVPCQKVCVPDMFPAWEEYEQMKVQLKKAQGIARMAKAREAKLKKAKA